MTRIRFGGFLLAAAALTFACGPNDAKTVLSDAAATLGADDMSTIRFTGAGTNYALGQNARPDAPWPKFNVVRYERVIDFETSSSREELRRTQGEDPPRGGGGQPLAGEQLQVFFVSGDQAWNLAGDTATPAPAAVAERSLQILLTPHGFVKAALAAEPMLIEETAGGGKLHVVSFQHGSHSIRATINGQNLVEKIETTIENTVLGEMPVTTSFSEYEDFEGVQFPTRIVQEQGGHATLDITVTEVAKNAPAEIAVPEAIATAEPAAVAVTSEPLANGVWMLAGGSHNSVLVEFADHLVIVEAPLNGQRSEAVMAQAESLVPGKPIKYLVNTHHHFDHSGGVRAYASKGVTIVTHEVNLPFYQGLFSSATFDPVTDEHVLTDGKRRLEIHLIQGNAHNDGLLMAYLPAEKILIEADAFSPRPGPPPSPPNPFSVNLHENIVRLNLAVDRIAPIHGPVVPLAELRTAIGEGATD